MPVRRSESKPETFSDALMPQIGAKKNLSDGRYSLNVFKSLSKGTDVHWSKKKEEFVVTAEKIHFIPGAQKVANVLSRHKVSDTLDKLESNLNLLAKEVTDVSMFNEDDKAFLKNEYLEARKGILNFQETHSSKKTEARITAMLDKVDQAFARGRNYEEFTHDDWEREMAKAHAPKSAGGKKAIKYNVSLWYNQLKSITAKNKWSWSNEIGGPEKKVTDPITLGAIPLFREFGDNDLEKLKEQGIKAILCTTEFFEVHAKGVLSAPVRPTQWKDEDIKHLQIATPDFMPMTQEDINKGVEFIKWNVDNGRPIYIHCKAGRARSALVLSCYLLKYHGDKFKTPEQAIAYIRESRSQAKLDGSKMECAREYHREYQVEGIRSKVKEGISLVSLYKPESGVSNRVLVRYLLKYHPDQFKTIDAALQFIQTHRPGAVLEEEKIKKKNFLKRIFSK